MSSAQQEQRIGGQGTQNGRHDEEENQHNFLAPQVAEKTEGKRDGAGKVRHNFQRKP